MFDSSFSFNSEKLISKVFLSFFKLIKIKSLFNSSNVFPKYISKHKQSSAFITLLKMNFNPLPKKQNEEVLYFID